jgi:polysaccharide pyruvyl transferase WcaK-like protein
MRVALTNMCTDGNRGDLAILAGTIEAVRRAVPDAEFRIFPVEVEGSPKGQSLQQDSAALSDLPLQFSPIPSMRDGERSRLGWMARTARAIGSERLRSESLNARPDREFRTAIEESDLVIAKGGSWLFSYPTVAQYIFAHRMLHPLRVAQSVGTPTMVLGTSLGPWQPAVKRSMITTLQRCAQVVVRERLSYRFAQEMELGAKAVLGVDMAFALHSQMRPPAVPREGVAITPRLLPYEDSEARDRYVKAVVETARMIIDSYGEKCYVTTQVSEDLPLCRHLVEAIDRSASVELVDAATEISLPDLVGWYASRRLILGTRLHSIISAGFSYTPSVILECDPPKMVGISEQMGLDQWRIRAGAPEVLSLESKTREALESVALTESTLERTMPELEVEAYRQTADAMVAGGLAGAITI